MIITLYVDPPYSWNNYDNNIINVASGCMSETLLDAWMNIGPPIL